MPGPSTTFSPIASVAGSAGQGKVVERKRLQRYIHSAFKQGDAHPREQELFLEKPRECVPGLQPGKVLRIVKGISGLAAAQRHCWPMLKKTLLGLQCTFKRSLVGPALFIGHGRDRCLLGIMCGHADDLLIAVGDKKAHELVGKHIPFGSWEEPPSVS